MLCYLPTANPLTAPSRRERPTGNFASQNCRIVLAFSVENVSPSGWRLRRHTSPSPFRLMLYSHFQLKMSRPSGGGFAAILPLAFQANVVLAFSAENVSPSGWRLRRHTSPSPSLGVRASGLNCRARASPGIVGLKPQQADLLRKFLRLPPFHPGRLKLYETSGRSLHDSTKFIPNQFAC